MSGDRAPHGISLKARFIKVLLLFEFQLLILNDSSGTSVRLLSKWDNSIGSYTIFF